jgi:hypothetical protein
MTLAKASALAIGFVGAVALGIWISPLVHEYLPQAAPRPVATASRPAAHATARHAVAAISTSTPALQARLKPLLNRGADMNLAAKGFESPEQFAAVVHAARDTEIPFVLLKYRVLDQGKTLAAAIRESKPDLNVVTQASLAREQARHDLTVIGG